MLAARDQENLTYAHQTNAASKILNQGIRTLQSKDPGPGAPKTPFKTSLNDENDPAAFATQQKGFKTAAKGNGDLIQTKKNGKLDNNAFITPMGGRGRFSIPIKADQCSGPRTRAPLGMKTTNAKARAFQTPAPGQPTVKPEKTVKKASTTRRSVKSKIRIAPSEPVESDILSKDPDSDVPDIEYCPPAPIDLPDPPEDITYDDNFPYLRGNNLFSGYADVYDIPRDEHGVSLQERKDEEAHAKILQEMEDNFRKEMAKPLPLETEDDLVDAMIAAGPKKLLNQGSKVDTVRAKGAVAALSSQPQTKLPSVAMKETASSKQKKKSSLQVLETKKTPLQPTNPSPMRHNAAVAASKTTIGYSKGRSVSSVLPEKIVKASKTKLEKPDQSKIHPLEFRELYGEPPFGSQMWDRFREQGLFDDDILDEEDDLVGQIWGMDLHSQDEEGEIFQLPMPEEV